MIKHKWIVGARNKLSEICSEFDTCAAIEGAKESEDEMIRKEIIKFLELPHPQFVGNRKHKEWIAWLEKQSEPQPYRGNGILMKRN